MFVKLPFDSIVVRRNWVGILSSIDNKVYYTIIKILSLKVTEREHEGLSLSKLAIRIIFFSQFVVESKRK